MEKHERGTVTVLMAGVMMLAAVMMWGAAQFGGAMVARSQAQTAADAAALAGAVNGEQAAYNLAAANAATVVSFSLVTSESGNDAHVTVSVGDAQASADAHYELPPPPPPPPVEPTTTTTTTEAQPPSTSTTDVPI